MSLPPQVSSAVLLTVTEILGLEARISGLDNQTVTVSPQVSSAVLLTVAGTLLAGVSDLIAECSKF